MTLFLIALIPFIASLFIRPMTDVWKTVGCRRAEPNIDYSQSPDRNSSFCCFDSAAWSSLLQAESVRPGASEEPVAQAMDWRDGACEAFLAAYGQVIDCLLTALYRQETFHRLVTVFLIEKACYEIAYEAAHRPSWLVVPLWGLISLLATEELETDGTPG